MDRETRRELAAEIHTERERLLPLRARATRTTIALVRQNTEQPPELVPYLNLAFLLGVRRTQGPDAVLAFALSLANWAVATVDEVARCTGRTAEQVIDQYETDIMAVHAEPDDG
ncbi:hypothetical protein AB0G74_24200 [Streptomyces sp. NPDC020875]|uniref:hypothetical protein n=1 Tax=Streptomyces sp. NPDC020875 TaxID=3154898 RepID=UPI0033F2E3BF